MKRWQSELAYDALAPLVASDDAAIALFARRDLLHEKARVEDLWHLPELLRILKRQRPDGSWAYPAVRKHIRTRENYDQFETYRALGILVEQFGLDRRHPAIERAAEFLLSFQSRTGDLRGIYGNQYTPNYSAGITELLVKAGYQRDARVDRVFEWLLSIRQQDGGWAIPFRTRGKKLDVVASRAATLEPDLSKPFSHMVTGVVLRAFAAHPTRRRSAAAQQAGRLLVASLFRKDSYPDRAASEYWLRFSFPFWFTDLISALDSLSSLGFSRSEPQIARALDWFSRRQKRNGLWELKMLKDRRREVLQQWLALAYCRVLARLRGS